MTAVNPAAYISASSHPADSFRRAIQAAMRGGYGVETWSTGAGDLLVSQNGTPNMSVNVAAGRCVIQGTQNTTYQAVYEALNDAVVNLTIAAADQTNPRNDLVVASVQDAQYSGSNNQWLLQVVTGITAPTPSDPTVPANSITLARVRVNAGAGSITNSVITDLRPALATTANLAGQLVQATGLTGAQQTSRWTGAVAGAAPTTGTFNVGDWVTDTTLGIVWMCTVAGSPGTWAPTSRVKLGRFSGTGSSGTISATIPTGFNHLETYWRARDTSTNTAGDDMTIRFNNDSTGIYYGTDAYDNGTNNANATQYAAASTVKFGVTAGGGQVAGVVAGGMLWVQSISSTAQYKTWQSLYHQDNGATIPGNSGPLSRRASGHYSSLNALTSIQVLTTVQSFSTDTAFDIYGVV